MKKKKKTTSGFAQNIQDLQEHSSLAQSLFVERNSSEKKLTELGQFHDGRLPLSRLFGAHCSKSTVMDTPIPVTGESDEGYS